MKAVFLIKELSHKFLFQLQQLLVIKEVHFLIVLHQCGNKGAFLYSFCVSLCLAELY